MTSPVLKLGLLGLGGYAFYKVFLEQPKRSDSYYGGGEGDTDESSLYGGQTASDGMPKVTLPGSQIAGFVKGEGEGADYEIIYANLPLRLLYEWLKANSSVRLKMQLNSSKERAAFAELESDWRILRDEGAAWQIDPLLINSTSRSDSAHFKTEYAKNALQTGRIYATTSSDGVSSDWFIWKDGTQQRVPLDDFGLVAAPGPYASVLAFVGDIAELSGEGAQESGGGGIDVKGTLQGFGEKLAETAWEKGTEKAEEEASNWVSSWFDDE